MNLDDHLFGKGPKRILALDGGGVRGALTLEYLARMEKILRARHGGDPQFRLCHYFDLIGGTSTGSIIAAGLALGFPVDKLQQLYRDLADQVFQKPLWRFGLFVSKFPAEPLRKALEEQFGDEKLGSSKLLTGLMIMTKRLDTGSPWPIHNNPRGKYFSSRPGGTGIPNKEFLLRNVVRASTAAPHYFEPEILPVADGQIGAFVDGGVSPSNNPALQLLLTATLEGFGLQWPLGADRLLLVSIGTGSERIRMTAENVTKLPAAGLALRSLAALMNDCDWQVQTLLQWMSRTKTPWQIDREIGDLSGDFLGGSPLLSYLRYNVILDRDWLKDHLGLDREEDEVKGLRAMDNASNVTALARLGAEAAEKQMLEDHFPGSFDIPS